eukprot:TRINITY_DN14902_c0_g1_i5.p1 TRINITY_DN14902_c0_g1~~TRINITY_DN14902_c0_g1_i5.p1  ORF type:complete len:450 (-),score=10.41 TRINITY_DN14902_c0_g1_i5:18-1319(-)
MYNHESSSIAEKFLDPKAPDIQPPNPKYEESSSSKQPTPRYERNEAVQKAKQDMQQLVESHAEVKQAQEQTKCFTILFLFFSHFFPSVIKKQTSVMLQFVGGALAFIGLISLFLWLFLVYYNKCDVQLLETSEIPTNMVECKQRLLAQDTQLKIDIQGKWSNEEDYDFLGSGGPWQVQWKAYKANATIFHENMNSLLQQVQYQTSKWNNLPFFDVAEEAFFFQYQVQGTTGTAIMRTNINIQVLFDNFIINGFAMIDLRDALSSNFRQNSVCLVNPTWSHFPDKSYIDCQGNLFPTNYFSSSNFYQNWDCNGSAIDNEYSFVIKNTMSIQAPNISNFQALGDKLPQNISLNDMIIKQTPISSAIFDLEDQFRLYFDFMEVFVLDYCNKNGKDFCKSLFDPSFFDQNIHNVSFYVEIDNFWITFNAKTPVLQFM